MHGFTMPPSGFGPGSQPTEADGAELDYMPLPSGMRTYAQPYLDVADPAAARPALALLSRVALACDRVADGGAAEALDLAPLDPENRRLLAETLGEGEVSCRLDVAPKVTAVESVFAGVWALQSGARARVEIAPAPTAVAARAFTAVAPPQGTAAPRAPGVVNGPAMLAELLDRSAGWTRGAEPHVVNLTLLPHTPEDLDYLDAGLGRGAATLVSRGYGGVRVEATATRHVWRVRYFNSMDVLIQDGFEVTETPEVVLAAPEDLRDSAERIREVVEAIR
jgi:hydrogenase-1 operon protein HyaF